MNRHEKKSSHLHALGVLQIAISGFSFGFLGVFGKLAFSHSLLVGELLSYRFLAASLMMALGLGVFSPRRFHIHPRDLFICAGLGIFGYAVFSSFYFTAIQGVSVATASLLLYTYPVLVALGAHFTLGERLTRAQLIALPVAAVGLFVLLSKDLSTIARPENLYVSGRLLAIASGLLAAVCYAGYILVSSRFQKNIDPMTSGFYVMVFATLGLFCFHHPDTLKLRNFTMTQTLIVCGIALLCTVTPMVLFLSGLQKLGNTEASLLSTVEPVTAAVVGSLLLGETLSSQEWLGGALVLCALITTVLGAQNARPVSPARALD